VHFAAAVAWEILQPESSAPAPHDTIPQERMEAHHRGRGQPLGGESRARPGRTVDCAGSPAASLPAPMRCHQGPRSQSRPLPCTCMRILVMRCSRKILNVHVPKRLSNDGMTDDILTPTRIGPETIWSSVPVTHQVSFAASWVLIPFKSTIHLRSTSLC